LEKIIFETYEIKKKWGNDFYFNQFKVEIIRLSRYKTEMKNKNKLFYKRAKQKLDRK
jgi:hypothetical protein